MAVSAAVFWSTSNLLCLFLLYTAVTTHENATGYSLNTTYCDQNVTNNVTDNYTTTQPTDFYSTTQTTPRHNSTEEPIQPTSPAEPLPVSGRLLTPVTKVGSLCPCDEHKDVCDINCCCDRACSEEVALFTGCSVDTVSGKKQLCSNDVATYSLGSTIDGYSELQSSVRKEANYDVFCIHSQNRADGLSHPSPALPTDSNFDSLFKEFTSFSFGSENGGPVTPAELQALSGYQCGDVMVTAGESGQRGMFWLPAPCVTADCVDTNPAAFLKDQSSRCSRRVVLKQDCGSLLALSMDTYTDIRLFAGKTQDAAVRMPSFLFDSLVPVEVASVVLQSVDGTQTELMISGGKNLNPLLLNPTVCANVVLKEDGEEAAIHYSGNPGYVVGLSLVSGTRTAEGIARSIDPRDTVSLLHSAEDQDCLQGPHKRSPVLFGLDSVSGCTLRLQDAANCSLVLQVLLDVLRGPNHANFVASFGNSPLDHPLDWVPIESNFNPVEAQSCSIPLSLHLQIEWTKYGLLMNPQAQIVSIKEVIQTNTTSLDILSGGSSILSIRSSVAFVPVSAAALPGSRGTPTINAKLPFDFFFPFV
ncbi:tectonic-1 isoform X3 [Cebidichthys violaceus]|uniref:tectonic-1 isoform X3 n=1 Tax=Cebidichthys violaceus TaxID=271503 RepID=UPI0035CBC6E2